MLAVQEVQSNGQVVPELQSDVEWNGFGLVQLQKVLQTHLCHYNQMACYVLQYSLCTFRHLYNTIQHKHQYYYSDINPIEFRGISLNLRMRGIINLHNEAFY